MTRVRRSEEGGTLPPPGAVVPPAPPVAEAVPVQQKPMGWADGKRNLGLIGVAVHEDPDGRGWSLSASHGAPPHGFYATQNDAQAAGDRFMRAQLERTLSLLTEAEDLPRGSGRPRPCGVMLLYPADKISDKRRAVMAALMEVS